MKKALFLFAISTLLTTPIFSQVRSEMKLIKGGNSVIGGGYQYEFQGYSMIYLGKDADFEKLNQKGIAIGEIPKSNNVTMAVSVADFYISETEVSNAEYREFLLSKILTDAERTTFDRKMKLAAKGNEDARALWTPVFEKAAQLNILPDQACWTKDFVFAYNEPLTQHYFWHPAFDNYPVVGASWEQAKSYCKWLSEKANAVRESKGQAAQADFRLPTEVEWEYAARSGVQVEEESFRQQAYPWLGTKVFDEKGRYLANIKTDPSNYVGDNYEYTAPVKSFPATEMGLYDMAGNVSEWCEDVFRLNQTTPDLNPSKFERDAIQLFNQSEGIGTKRVVKGGSWAEYKYAAQCGSRTAFEQNLGSSRIGFRVAINAE